MISLPTFRDWLGTRNQDELAEVIESSPLAQAGARIRSLDELAQRLSHPASVAQTLYQVPLPVLEVVEAASALGEAATVATLTDLLDSAAPSPEYMPHERSVAHWLDGAQRAALLWRDGGRLRINPGFDLLIGMPLALGRPARTLLASLISDDLAAILKSRGITVPPRKAERLHEAIAAFGDVDSLRAVAASAPGKVLESLAAHVSQRLTLAHYTAPYDSGDADDAVHDETDNWYSDGVLDRDRDQLDQDRARWASAAGLGVGARSWGFSSQTEMPSEVYLALAPPRFRVPFHPAPSPVTLAVVSREQVLRGSGAALAHFASAAMAIYETVARDGLVALKRGGVGSRELGRLAKGVGEDTSTVRLALELGADLRLFDMRGDGRLGVSEHFDRWRRRPPRTQALDLVAHWMMLEFVPTAEQDPSGVALPALGRDRLRTGVPNGAQLTATLVATTADADASDRRPRTTDDGNRSGAHAPADIVAITSAAALIDMITWTNPMVPASSTAFACTWSEAQILGVVSDGAVALFARALLTGDEQAAESLLREALPAHSSKALFGSDLTVVVAGNPSPDMADVLAIVATREGHGAANTWRASEMSVRSALDLGYTAEDLAESLRQIAGGSLPQTWEYLLADTARKHGRLKVASSAAVIVCEDEALLAEVVASRALRTLRLHLAAPTVAVSQVNADESLRRLRGAGFLPVEVDADGAPVVTLRRSPRPAPAPAPAPHSEEEPLPDTAQPEDNVIQLFRSDADAQTAEPSTTESAAGLAARLLSSDPDSNPYAGEVQDIAEVERHIAQYNRRLSSVEVHELADAETRVQPVTIRYRSQSGSDSVRTLSQLNVVGDNLFAFCHLRGAERVFRLDRILEVVPAL